MPGSVRCRALSRLSTNHRQGQHRRQQRFPLQSMGRFPEAPATPAAGWSARARGFPFVTPSRQGTNYAARAPASREEGRTDPGFSRAPPLWTSRGCGHLLLWETICAMEDTRKHLRVHSLHLTMTLWPAWTSLGPTRDRMMKTQCARLYKEGAANVTKKGHNHALF